MRVPRSGALLAAALFLSLGLGACSSKASTSSTSSTTASAASGSTTSAPAGSSTTAAPAATAGKITIQGFKFGPDPSSAKVGDTITVTNQDGTDHSLTATDGSFDTGVFSSGSKTFTVSKAGTFAFHCKIHNFMTGTLTVSS
jgi:plastocyanin